MRIKTMMLGALLALMGLAGCETTDDGYYDGPREYRGRPDYVYVDRRPPPIYRGYDRPRGYYDGGGYDGPRRGYDGGSRRYQNDDRRDDRRSDRGDRGNGRPEVVQASPRPQAPPRAYQPPVRNDPASDSRGEARSPGRPNGPAAVACAGPGPVPEFCKNL